MLESLLIKLGVSLVTSYIESSSSKKDDKVLELVQTGASYLAKKPNNTVDNSLSVQLNEKSMNQVQKAK